MNDTIKKVPLGVENYAEACSYYVDKTLILKDIIDPLFLEFVRA